MAKSKKDKTSSKKKKAKKLNLLPRKKRRRIKASTTSSHSTAAENKESPSSPELDSGTAAISIAIEAEDETMTLATNMTTTKPVPQQRVQKASRRHPRLRKAATAFFTSWVGLLVVVSLYTVASGLWFRSLEEPLEAARNQRMVEAHEEINRSVGYLADFLADKHYSPKQTYDNCSVYVKDKFYAPRGSYASACLTGGWSKVRSSYFCQCIRAYRIRYEREVF